MHRKLTMSFLVAPRRLILGSPSVVREDRKACVKTTAHMNNHPDYFHPYALDGLDF